MHELRVCQALLDQIAEVAARENGTAVSAVTVRIGPLSGIEPHLLMQAFILARAGTIAQDGDLVIEPEPVRIRCRTCGDERETEPNRLRCATCGRGPVELTSGDAMILVSLSIERAATPATERGAAYV